jgi:hypothetical protein
MASGWGGINIRRTRHSITFYVHCRCCWTMLINCSVLNKNHESAHTLVLVTWIWFICVPGPSSLRGTICIFKCVSDLRSQYTSWSSCNRPARSRFSVGFLFSRTNGEFVPRILCSTECCICSHPKRSLKISSFPTRSKFAHNAPFQKPKLSPNTEVLFPSAFSQHSIYHHSIFLTSQHLTLFESTRRTSRHCLGTFRAVKLCPCENNKHCIVSNCALHLFILYK